jgi:nucleoside-diphosphate-sugar epimerase
MKRVFIIGSRGFIGSRLVSKLSTHGYAVSTWSTADLHTSSPQMLSGSIHESIEIPERTDIVIYLSQSPHFRSLECAHHVLNVNAVSPVTLALKARSCGAGQFVYFSTGSIYLPSLCAIKESFPLDRSSLYSLSKIHAEEGLHLLRNSLDIKILRPFGVYGQGQVGRLIQTIRDRIATSTAVELDRDETSSIHDGLRISLMHVNDAIEYILQVLEIPGNVTVNLAGPHSYSIRSISDLIGSTLSIPVQYTEVPRVRKGNLIACTELTSQLASVECIRLEDVIASCL